MNIPFSNENASDFAAAGRDTSVVCKRFPASSQILSKPHSEGNETPHRGEDQSPMGGLPTALPIAPLQDEGMCCHNEYCRAAVCPAWSISQARLTGPQLIDVGRTDARKLPIPPDPPMSHGLWYCELSLKRYHSKSGSRCRCCLFCFHLFFLDQSSPLVRSYLPQIFDWWTFA